MQRAQTVLSKAVEVTKTQPLPPLPFLACTKYQQTNKLKYQKLIKQQSYQNILLSHILEQQLPSVSLPDVLKGLECFSAQQLVDPKIYHHSGYLTSEFWFLISHYLLHVKKILNFYTKL